MLQPTSNDWPLGYGGAEARRGSARQRHEIALERYLERQASHRPSAAHRSFVLFATTWLSVIEAGLGRIMKMSHSPTSSPSN